MRVVMCRSIPHQFKKYEKLSNGMIKDKRFGSTDNVLEADLDEVKTGSIDLVARNYKVYERLDVMCF